MRGEVQEGFEVEGRGEIFLVVLGVEAESIDYIFFFYGADYLTFSEDNASTFAAGHTNIRTAQA